MTMVKHKLRFSFHLCVEGECALILLIGAITLWCLTLRISFVKEQNLGRDILSVLVTCAFILLMVDVTVFRANFSTAFVNDSFGKIFSRVSFLAAFSFGKGIIFSIEDV